MKLNPGIITSKLGATKEFYTKKLGFGITFEADRYILLHTPDHQYEISFLQPNLENQSSLFQKEFNGQGMYLTIEVNDVDALYEEMKTGEIGILQSSILTEFELISGSIVE